MEKLPELRAQEVEKQQALLNDKLEEAKSVELPRLLAKAEETGLQEDSQAARDYASMIERFEKKIYDLELTRNIS